MPDHSSTMIRGDIVNIREATLKMTIQVNELVNREKTLDLLRSNCSLAALVDASQRYDPPRCAEATRRDIIHRLEDWIHHDNPLSPPSSIFWLFGGAGAGKSALAQTLAEKFKTNEDLAASFFFFKADVNRNDGNRLIPTLALQLGQSFHGLTPIVEDMILRNSDLFHRSRQTQMLELLVAPLIKLSLAETDGEPYTALKPHPRLVVIDGLDECVDLNIQCDLLRIIAIAVPHFPYPLRFLITSRPESHITRAFQHDVGRVAQYDLSDDSDADKDIRKYLGDEFAKIHRTHPLRQYLPSQWPHPADVGPIVERSSAHFIYASTVIRFIQSPKHRPDDRLQVILGLKQPYEKERPYAPLDLLYTLIFLEIQDSSQLETIHRALGIIHLRSLKLGIFGWAQWSSDRHSIEVLLELRPGDIVLLFDPLLSLVTFNKDDIRIFHKSLFDYLLDSSRSGIHRLDLGLANETAANRILRLRNPEDSWHLEEFEYFVYHCQFAHLNVSLTGHIRALACDPKVKVVGSPPLQSILYFLQVISRQDFDSSGHCYREYVRNMNQHFRSVTPSRQRLKSVIFWLMHPDLILKPISIERGVRLSLEEIFKAIDLKDLGWRNTTPIPPVNSGVTKSIEQEHEMFSSYLKVNHPYPDFVLSFVEQSSELIHSCHLVLQDTGQSVSVIWVTFLMLVTYTERGVRLSCSEFKSLTSLRHDSRHNNRVREVVEKHFRSTQEEVNNDHTKLFKGTY